MINFGTNVDSGLLFTRGPLVYAGDYNGTDIDAGVYKGSPCVWIDYSISLVLKLESIKRTI